VVLAGGAEQPRDLPIPGRGLAGFISRWISCRSKIGVIQGMWSLSKSSPLVNTSW
jgi:hypothetical protein